MRRGFTDPHYWKNPALRRSREKYEKILEPVNPFKKNEKYNLTCIFLMSIENKYKKCKSENATFHVNLKNVKKCKS
jgi:hypothetical protein